MSLLDMQLAVVIRPQRIDRGETRDAHARRAFMAKKILSGQLTPGC